MAIPLSASASFGAQDPLGPGAARRLILGGTTLPLEAPATGGDLLPACDPFLAAALPYFQHVIVTRLGRAYAAAMAGQVTALTNGACVDTSPIDPGPYLGSGLLSLPLLALYPVNGRHGERTRHKDKIDALYRAVYLLPALTWEQNTRIVPLLTAAAKLLALAIKEGHVADYRNDVNVWQSSSGVSAVRMAEHRVGPAAAAEDTANAKAHYALEADIQVEMIEAYDSASGNPLWSFGLQIDAANNEGLPLPGLTQARVTVG